MLPFHQVIEDPASHRHIVQLYREDERVLARNVSCYIRDGLAGGGAVLLVATRENTDAFLQRLQQMGVDLVPAMSQGRLVMLDAEETLASVLHEGEPDWVRFEATIRGAIDELRPFAPTGLRAYGEMVALLWKAGQPRAAVRLEEFWNRLLAAADFQLFCAYPIDVFGSEFQAATVDGILCSHTHVLSAGENGDVETALDRAMDEVLGSNGAAVRASMDGTHPPAWAALPRAEARILWLRANLPEHAETVVTRARHNYQTEKRFQALVENSSDAICLLNAEMRVLYASASTERVLGYGAHELLSRDSLDLIHADDIEKVKQCLGETQAKPGTPIALQARLRHHDGHWCCIEGTATNLLDNRDVGAIVLNYRDISERIAAEEILRRQAEALARSNAELRAFAWAASHDLKEPLRTVCSYTQLMLQRTALDDEGKQFAGFIVDGVKRMTTLLDDLLSFASIASGERQPVDLRSAAEQAARNLGSAIQESGATVTIGALPTVQGCATQLVEVFQNLIGNAIKYRREAPPEIHITADRVGPDFVVRVRDNGIGIDAQYHDVVFGVFKRLHNRDVPGTGIGLALCRKIIEGMNGKIWIESREGTGSTFCFTVPADHTAAAIRTC